MPYTHYPTPTPYQIPYPMQTQMPPTQLSPLQTQNQQLQLAQLQNFQIPTQLPVQPIANPNNNKMSHPIYNIEIPSLPTYFITSVPLLGVQLRSRVNVQLEPPIVTIEEHEEEQQYDEDLGGKERETNSRKQTIIQTGQLQTPPYHERLTIEKPVVSLEFNLEAELKNICV